MVSSVTPRHLVITVHGIRTFGHWQERLEALVREREPDVRVQHYKYGYFSCIAFLVPPLRWLVTRHFRRALVAACSGPAPVRVDVVAHSFGTHLVAWALHGLARERRPRIHTLILAGSVLKPAFPWQELTPECVGRVVNDCGTEDTILVLNQGTVLFTGMAGRVGFAGMSHERFRNRFFAHGHSGYFLREGRESDEFMRTWWLPLLFGEEPIALPADPRRGSTLEGLLTFALNNSEPVKVALFLAPLVFLSLLFFGLYREADTQRAASQRRLVELLVANGQRRTEESDHATALVWFAEALRASDEASSRDQRVRYATALRQLPGLELMLFLREWRPRRVVVSPDGELVALAGGLFETQGARVWNIETGEATPVLEHSNVVESLAFSADGERLATGSGDHTARVWDARSGVPLTPPLRHDADVRRVRFSPAGDSLLTLGDVGLDGVGRVRVWNARSGSLALVLPHPDELADADFSPDGARVVTITDTEEGATRIWDVGTGVATCPVIQTGDWGLIARFGPHGGRVVTVDEGAIRVWDAASGSALGGPWSVSMCAHVEFRGEDKVMAIDGFGSTHFWSVRENARVAGPFAHGSVRGTAYAVSAPSSSAPWPSVLLDPQRLALADDDRVRVWETRSDRPVTPLLRHSGSVAAAQISADGRRLVTLDTAEVVRVWALRALAERELEQRAPFETPDVCQVSFDPVAARVITVARDPSVIGIWDAVTGESGGVLARGLDAEWARFSPDGRRVLTGGRDGAARMWNVETAAPVGSVMEHGQRVADGCFSADGARIVIACNDGKARVWDAVDPSAPLATIEHGPPIVSVAFAPDSRAVLIAGGASARLYDVESGAVLTAGPPQNDEGVLTAALSPDGLRIATGGLDGVVRVWDAKSGEALTPPLLHTAGPKRASFSQRVNHVTFSPDSRLLASSSSDTTTRVWDAMSGVLAVPVLAGAEEHAAFSPDGTRVATAGSGGARVWDTRTGAALTPPLLHAGPVLYVDFASDGMHLATASRDGTTRIWSLAPDERSPDELRRLAEVLAGQRVDDTGGLVDLTPEELQFRWELLGGHAQR